MGQFLLIRNLASNEEKQMALTVNYYYEAKDIKVTMKIKSNDKLLNFSFRF